MRSRLEPMKKVARMLRTHDGLILNWFKARAQVSTGATEGLELWYWLHFDLQQTSVSRDDYASRLSERLKRKYHKADLTLYDELKPHQSDAIRNSRRLLSFYAPSNPEKDDPSTTVHTLVEYLNEFGP